MSAQITEIKNYAARANESTVALLRDFLEQAERGEIVSVAVAAVEPSGACRTQSSLVEHYQSLLGALSILQHRMIGERS